MLTKKAWLLLPLGLITLACGTAKKSASHSNYTVIVDDGTSTPVPTGATPPVTAPKTYGPIQHKYAAYLNVPPGEITNMRLYGFIDEWLSTPYLWGGTDKRGIDCSAFMQKLLDQVYTIRIPRTSIQQFFTDYIERFGSKKYLSEGDLVFFKTIGENVVSHVGLYLGNRKFINASSSKGVSIASLDDAYWKKRYVAAGRVRTSMLTNYKDK